MFARNRSSFESRVLEAVFMFLRAPFELNYTRGFWLPSGTGKKKRVISWWWHLLTFPKRVGFFSQRPIENVGGIYLGCTILRLLPLTRSFSPVVRWKCVLCVLTRQARVYNTDRPRLRIYQLGMFLLHFALRSPTCRTYSKLISCISSDIYLVFPLAVAALNKRYKIKRV